MDTRLEKVKEFMLTFGQNVADKPIVLDKDTQKLRIALIFEELKEYAEASGKLDYFSELCINTASDFAKNTLEYVPVVNQVEQFDALLDLEYVLLGAVHSHGFGNIFDAGFDEVQSSNMSKADDTYQEALKTQEYYNYQGTLTKINSISINKDADIKHINYRKEDNKVLKSHKYKPAQLAQFLK